MDLEKKMFEGEFFLSLSFKQLVILDFLRKRIILTFSEAAESVQTGGQSLVEEKFEVETKVIVIIFIENRVFYSQLGIQVALELFVTLCQMKIPERLAEVQIKEPK